MPGTGPTLTWHLWAVTPFPRRDWVTSQTSLSQGRETDLADAACGLPWPFAGPGATDQHGAMPTGKKATKPARAQEKFWREREGLSSGRAWQSHSLHRHTSFPPSGERMERPQTSVQLPNGQNRIPGAPGTLPGSGDTRSLPACSQQGVPSFGLASVPPTLKEMSPAHSLSCNKPQQNHRLPGALFPRLCGQTRSGSPPVAALLAEESEVAGDPWEQQPDHGRARSRAATATGTRSAARQRAQAPRGSGGSAAGDGGRR